MAKQLYSVCVLYDKAEQNEQCKIHWRFLAVCICDILCVFEVVGKVFLPVILTTIAIYIHSAKLNASNEMNFIDRLFMCPQTTDHSTWNAAVRILRNVTKKNEMIRSHNNNYNNRK